MDTFLTVDNMEKIRTLGFIHNNIEVLSYNTISYTEDGVTYIADLDDNILIQGKESNIKTCGTFVVQSFTKKYNGENKVHIYNMLTFKEVEPLLITVENTSDINVLGDQFIAIRQRLNKHDWRSYAHVIYNKHLRKVFEIKDYNAIGYRRNYCLEDTPIKSKISYLLNGHWKTMVLSKVKEDVDIFDVVELDMEKGIQLIGVEWSEQAWLSVSNYTVDNVKYKLSIMGKIVGKAYQDIVKPQELHNTDYFLVYDTLNKRICKGLIDTQGKELIQPIYDDMKYIGENVFILTYQGYCIVFSLDKGLMLDSILSDNVWIHPTLPLTVIIKDSEYWIVDCYGRLYSLFDITKNFECYSTDKDKNILRINTGYKNVYVTNTLMPITNIHSIKMLHTYKWVRI